MLQRIVWSKDVGGRINGVRIRGGGGHEGGGGSGGVIKMCMSEILLSHMAEAGGCTAWIPWFGGGGLWVSKNMVLSTAGRGGIFA